MNVRGLRVVYDKGQDIGKLGNDFRNKAALDGIFR